MCWSDTIYDSFSFWVLNISRLVCMSVLAVVLVCEGVYSVCTLFVYITFEGLYMLTVKFILCFVWMVYCRFRQYEKVDQMIRGFLFLRELRGCIWEQILKKIGRHGLKRCRLSRACFLECLTVNWWLLLKILQCQRKSCGSACWKRVSVRKLYRTANK